MKKINLFIKKNIVLIMTIVIILQPIFDLIIGLSIQYNFFHNIASLLRFFILLFFIYYLIVISKYKYKNYFLLFLLAIVFYLFTYSQLMNFSFLEIKQALKVFYFPIILLSFISIQKETTKKLLKDSILIALGIYAAIIIMGQLTNTAFNSYSGVKLGTTGYFSAANEIGAIISILLPFVFNYVFNKVNLKKISYFLLIIIAILFLGTKTPIISFIICSIYCIIKVINKQNFFKIIFISLITIVFLFISLTFTPFYKNLKIHANFLEAKNISEIVVNPGKWDHFFLGSRFEFLKNNTEFYINSSINNKLIGIGYESYPKLVEMDFFDILYRQGIVGFLMVIVIGSNVFILNRKNYNKEYNLVFGLIILISFIVGHVLVAPAVSTFVALILCFSLRRDNDEIKYNRSSL